MKALMIGGTGPTGPHIIGGLIDRGYDVVMLNRGSRDSDAIPPSVERVVGDPHFPETLEAALGARTFDVVIATYGRLRHVAEVVSTRTDRLVTVGGMASYSGFGLPGTPEEYSPSGMPIPASEDAPLVESEEESRFGYLVRTTEDAIMAHHTAGTMNVTHYRYPIVYGPWQVRPTAFWWVMQRCLDQRPYVVLPNSGLAVTTRGYSKNLAHAVLLAVDKPQTSAGQIYNCGDERQFSFAQWVGLIAEAMDWQLEILSAPDRFASPARELMHVNGRGLHQYLDLSRICRQLGYSDRVDAVNAVRQTVQWFKDLPPVDESNVAALRAHYEVEDQLARIIRDANERMGALPHIESAFHHSYAHPRKPGLQRDHRNR